MGSFRRPIAALLAALLAVPAAASAQQPGSDPKATADTSSRAAKDEPADLPVSLDRIRRELVKSTSTTESKDGLKLRYYVQVYGRAPRIELFSPTENVTSAPVQYGGMTHQEFLNLVTPEEFRAPPADFSAAIAALVKWLSEKKSGGSAKR